MAKYLYRLGRFSFRHRLGVLAVWLVVLVAGGLLSAAYSRPPSTAFTIPGTQSQQAIDLLNQKFPQASGAMAQIVFEAPPGHTLTEPEMKTAVQATLARARAAGQVLFVTDPYTAGTISQNQRIAFAQATYKVPVANIGNKSKVQLEASAAPARAQGITVAYAGGVIAPPGQKSSEGLGILIAYIVLAITFGALIAAGLPLVTAIIGVAIGIFGINALGAVIDLSSTAPILATMIGLAVGIDYGLFILHRYRENLGEGLERAEAAARANATAGSAVFFAGLTVIIALSCLAVVNIPFLTVMGLAAAGTVLVAVLVALTLMPAFVSLLGSHITAPKPSRRRSATLVRSSTPAGRRWAHLVTTHHVYAILAGLAFVIVLALPSFGMRLGLPDAGSDPAGTTARTAYDLLQQGFGPGFNGPLLVVVDAPSKYNPSAIAALTVKGIESVPDVQSVSPTVQNATKDVTVVSVIPKSSPTSDATTTLVNSLRAKATQVANATGVDVLVTGQTAVNIDVSAKLSAALPEYVLLIVGLALVLLLLVFRSILVPLKAVIGFLLSIAAALGVTVFIFQDGHLDHVFGVNNPGPVVSFLPILLVGVLFGLAMDYEMFLVTRMREAFVKGAPPREAVQEGFADSARVVCAAAIIMISVFGSFVLTNDLITKSIGLALAVGVAVDAFIVRMTLVPAVMAMMGKTAWWLPRPIDRVLPDMDVEGAHLATGPIGEQAAETPYSRQPAG